MEFSFWFLIVGVLLANGMMHFVVGLSGHRFISWFGNAPKANVAWGVSNVLGATGLLGWYLGEDVQITTSDMMCLILGFWLVFIFAAIAITKVLPRLNSSDEKN